MYEPDETHEALVLVGDPVACAWEWIGKYAQQLTAMMDEDDWGGEVTRQELIEVATSHIIEPDLSYKGYWAGDYITRGGAFEGVSVEPLFWEKYALVMGEDYDPKKHDGHFFSCSC